MNEVAKVLQDLGCKDAGSLDGVGSTMLIVNRVFTNRSSDVTGMKFVKNTLMLVSQTKPKRLVEDVVGIKLREIFDEEILEIEKGNVI